MNGQWLAQESQHGVSRMAIVLKVGAEPPGERCYECDEVIHETTGVPQQIVCGDAQAGPEQRIMPDWYCTECTSFILRQCGQRGCVSCKVTETAAFKPKNPDESEGEYVQVQRAPTISGSGEILDLRSIGYRTPWHFTLEPLVMCLSCMRREDQRLQELANASNYEIYVTVADEVREEVLATHKPTIPEWVTRVPMWVHVRDAMMDE